MSVLPWRNQFPRRLELQDASPILNHIHPVISLKCLSITMHYLNYQSFSDEKQDSLHEEQSQNIKGPVTFFTTEASANLKHSVGMAYWFTCPAHVECCGFMSRSGHTKIMKMVQTASLLGTQTLH